MTTSSPKIVGISIPKMLHFSLSTQLLNLADSSGIMKALDRLSVITMDVSDKKQKLALAGCDCQCSMVMVAC